ncbi:MAG: phosphatidate cytidylyltransferase [Treponema sp.]|jgi:phosphatidate cytidylyltransferase|nr:phosphatidate cytidylyltransferase [Treponema sp.]
MSKLVQRFVVFAIGLPLIVFIVIFLPQRYHLFLNILVIVFSSLGAMEFSDILRKKGFPVRLWEAALLGMASPVAETLTVSFGVTNRIISAVFIFFAGCILVSLVFSREDRLHDAVNRAICGFSLIIYPGLFMSWIIRMAHWENAYYVILFFLLIVMANDSAAWACGMLFGKGNRGLIPASPNKSIAGFIGGLAASVLVGMGASLFLKEAFQPEALSPALSGFILGSFTGIAAALGDLGESALKRSAGVKDSGGLIPGRGGILDSIDSIALAAPVFYAVYWFLF